MEQENSEAAGALLLIGLWSDDGRNLRGTIERVGTEDRVEIGGWDELLLAIQQLAPNFAQTGTTVDRKTVSSVLERLAAWYAVQPPQDRLILSRLISGKRQADVRAFGEGPDESPTLLEPDEIVLLESVFTDTDLQEIRALLATSDG